MLRSSISRRSLSSSACCPTENARNASIRLRASASLARRAMRYAVFSPGSYSNWGRLNPIEPGGRCSWTVFMLGAALSQAPPPIGAAKLENICPCWNPGAAAMFGGLSVCWIWKGLLPSHLSSDCLYSAQHSSVCRIICANLLRS